MKNTTNMFSSMKELENIQNAQTTLNYVSQTNNIRKGNHKLILNFKSQLSKDILDASKKIELGDWKISDNNTTYIIKNHNAHITKYDFYCLNDQDIEIEISALDDQRITNEETFLRLIQPINREFWVFYIQRQTIQTDSTKHEEFIPIKFPKGEIHVYSSYSTIFGGKYLIIEPQYKTNKDDLIKIQYSIAMGFGMITGYAPFDEFYIVSSNNLDFQNIIGCSFSSMRDSINSFYFSFSTNIWMLKDKVSKGKYNSYTQTQLKTMTSIDELNSDEYSPIFLNLYNNEDFARAVMILIDNTTAALDFQTAIFGVALETITTQLQKVNNTKIGTIIEKSVWSKIHDTTITTFENNIKTELDSTTISNEEKTEIIRRMKSKFNNLNQKSNLEKFIILIEATGVKLSKRDKEILDQRNRLLHGNMTTGDNTIDNAFYYAASLFSICMRTLFRQFGYKRYLVNIPIFYDFEKACIDKEQLLLQ